MLKFLTSPATFITCSIIYCVALLGILAFNVQQSWGVGAKFPDSGCLVDAVHIDSKGVKVMAYCSDPADKITLSCWEAPAVLDLTSKPSIIEPYKQCVITMRKGE
jgi:hypothetical protein